MAIVKIQHRRGNYDDYDPSKVLPGEMVVTLANDPNAPDGRAAYIGTVSGHVKQLATVEDMESEVATALNEAIPPAVASATQRAETAASRAETAAQTLTIDNTLTHAGQAADAKATGDEITALKQDLTELETDLKGTFNESIDIDIIIGKNKLITDTVTVTGNVGATRNVSGNVYLENGKTYRVQLWNSGTPDFHNITSSKLTIRDNTDTTDIVTIVSYNAINKNGTTFEWTGTSGWYKFHAIVASANTVSSDVLQNGFFVYYDSLYPSEFEIGTATTKYTAKNSKNSKKLDDKTYSDLLSDMKSLISNGFYSAIGDSITAGSGASRYSKCYYWLLSSMLINNGLVDKRINIGVAGAGAQAIASNCGAYGIYLTSDATIPATTTGVEIQINRDIYNAGGIIIESNRNNPCYLSGISGNLTYSNGVYTFTRSEAGTETYVASGTSLLLYAGKIAEESEIITIFVGTNDALDTDQSDAKNNAVIDVIDTITRLSKTGKYVVVNPYVNSVNNNFRHALSAKYGQRYLDMYSYLSGQGVYDAIAKGIIESGSQSDWQTLLLSDGLHPNDAGHRLIADKIYERINNLGWN